MNIENKITDAIKMGGPTRTNLHKNKEVVDFLKKLPFEQQLFWAYKIDGNFEIWKMILSNTTINQILYCHKNYNHAIPIGISLGRDDFMEYLLNLDLEEAIKYASELQRDQVWEIINKRKELAQSPNYDEVIEFLKNNPNKRIEGFPFSIAFPEMYRGDRYEIILVSGEKIIATVDDSREFMSEGLEWKTKYGNKEQSAVAAWKIIE